MLIIGLIIIIIISFSDRLLVFNSSLGNLLLGNTLIIIIVCTYIFSSTKYKLLLITQVTWQIRKNSTLNFVAWSTCTHNSKLMFYSICFHGLLSRGFSFISNFYDFNFSCKYFLLIYYCVWRRVSSFSVKTRDRLKGALGGRLIHSFFLLLFDL